MPQPRRKRGPNPDAGKRVVLKRDDPQEGVESDLSRWVVVDTVEAKTDRAAIEAVAGKPNTPDAKPGTYKSVPLSNWKGQAVYERPPEPLVGASWTDD